MQTTQYYVVHSKRLFIDVSIEQKKVHRETKKELKLKKRKSKLKLKNDEK